MPVLENDTQKGAAFLAGQNRWDRVVGSPMWSFGFRWLKEWAPVIAIYVVIVGVLVSSMILGSNAVRATLDEVEDNLIFRLNLVSTSLVNQMSNLSQDMREGFEVTDAELEAMEANFYDHRGRILLLEHVIEP